MKGCDGTLLTLRAEIEEAIELIDRAEKVLHKMPEKNMQLAAKFLNETNRCMVKHKKNKLDCRRSF